MNKSTKRLVKIGNITLGDNGIVIQSMCNIKTSNTKEVINQINELYDLGAKLMRVSIRDKDDAYALKEIKKHIKCPIVADIHFDSNLAVLAIENGADKIRINPGNIPLSTLENIVNKAKEYKVAIRIGVNSGSLDKETLLENDNKVTALGMISLVSKYIKFFEERNFYDLVISLKSSSPLVTIEAYRLANKIFNYPLHIGLTEAGNKDIGLIRSAACLSPLLLEGIGDTIRISLTEDPREEIIACKHLLLDLGLYKDAATLISCPTCGRTEVNLIKLVNEITPFINKINKPITIAIMGCVVNGPGEASHADIGLAGGKNKFVLFKKGKPYLTVEEKDALNTLKEEINKMLS